MIVFINGSFGVGKTTVSRLLVRQLPRSMLFDPEPIGLVLLHLRSAWPIGARVDDFQDLSGWRAVFVRLLRLASRFRRVVVVPMAFSNPAYLREVSTGAARGDGDALHFCLTAPLAIVHARLNEREGPRGPSAWQLRRSAECCEAHRSPDFAEHIPTEGRSPNEIASEILVRIRSEER
jgi:hypothetical protein